MTDLIGQQLGQYKIDGLLGEGGAATVYYATRASDNGKVAVKVIRPNLAGDSDFYERFLRESQVAAALDHPNILKVIDYGQVGMTIYMVMHLASGGSLADLMKRQHLSLESISSFLGPVTSGLDYAHQRGIVHRDLKPQNILMDDTGRLYLCDFGMAKLMADTGAMTRTGMVIGTPAYMSPEQCLAANVDARADIYSLGIMLFELLTGRLPFVSQSPLGMMSMHCNKLPPLVSEIKPGLPLPIDEVVGKALAKKTEERFGTAGELAAAFTAAVGGKVAAQPHTPRQPDKTGRENDVPTMVEIRRVRQPPAASAPTSPVGDDATMTEIPRVRQSPKPSAPPPAVRDIPPRDSQSPVPSASVSKAPAPLASKPPEKTTPAGKGPQIALLFALAGVVTLIAVVVAAVLTA